jgi:hypothetical protein
MVSVTPSNEMCWPLHVIDMKNGMHNPSASFPLPLPSHVMSRSPSSQRPRPGCCQRLVPGGRRFGGPTPKQGGERTQSHEQKAVVSRGEHCSDNSIPISCSLSSSHSKATMRHSQSNGPNRCLLAQPKCHRQLTSIGATSSVVL